MHLTIRTGDNDGGRFAHRPRPSEIGESEHADETCGQGVRRRHAGEARGRGVKGGVSKVEEAELRIRGWAR